MNQLRLWNNGPSALPWRGLMGMQRHLDQIMEQNFGEGALAKQEENFAQPTCDLDENETHFLMHVDLPGVNRKDIQVEVKDDRLFISGERRSETTRQGRTERYYGKLRRIVELPSTADLGQIEAQYQDGVLTIAVAKSQVEKPRQVKIAEGKSPAIEKIIGSDKASVRTDKTEKSVRVA